MIVLWLLSMGKPSDYVLWIQSKTSTKSPWPWPILSKEPFSLLAPLRLICSSITSSKRSLNKKILENRGREWDRTWKKEGVRVKVKENKKKYLFASAVDKRFPASSLRCPSSVHRPLLRLVQSPHLSRVSLFVSPFRFRDSISSLPHVYGSASSILLHHGCRFSSLALTTNLGFTAILSSPLSPSDRFFQPQVPFLSREQNVVLVPQKSKRTCLTCN